MAAKYHKIMLKKLLDLYKIQSVYHYNNIGRLTEIKGNNFRQQNTRTMNINHFHPNGHHSFTNEQKKFNPWSWHYTYFPQNPKLRSIYQIKPRNVNKSNEQCIQKNLQKWDYNKPIYLMIRFVGENRRRDENGSEEDDEKNRSDGCGSHSFFTRGLSWRSDPLNNREKIIY